ncbi:retrovirus-related Pol polyprotein from transposon TNT 1-94 [Nephila pilipes]|uniref:Retrovirus-related Pol polyprotein from transposon TNT 1-94 n=1 Tax=Nephila pilipes TaxID=299642 RepID=A0A8X6NLB1_NEPPI|nr:retrovirus-related Pol polyprotein from transposon TNT 1-94 [Nephila pilipes]
MVKENLSSEGGIISKGMKLVKLPGHADIYNCEDKLVGTPVRSTNNLYHMVLRNITSTEANKSQRDSLIICHERTGRTNLKAMCELSDKDHIKKLDQSEKEKILPQRMPVWH